MSTFTSEEYLAVMSAMNRYVIMLEDTENDARERGRDDLVKSASTKLKAANAAARKIGTL